LAPVIYQKAQRRIAHALPKVPKLPLCAGLQLSTPIWPRPAFGLAKRRNMTRFKAPALPQSINRVGELLAQGRITCSREAVFERRNYRIHIDLKCSINNAVRAQTFQRRVSSRIRAE